MDTTANNEFEKLKIYIEYDYLTVNQLSEILGSLDGIYNALTKIFVYDNFEYTSTPNIIYHPVPLCIQEVQTGNSIDILISFSNEALPSLTLTNNQPQIILPVWSALIIVLGWTAKWGIDFYKPYVDIKKTNIDIDKTKEDIERSKLERKKIELEIEEKVRALNIAKEKEFEEKSKTIEAGKIKLEKLNESSSANEEIRTNFHKLQTVIKRKNIKKALINGEVVKG